MGEPHAFSDLIGQQAPAEPEDRPKVVGGPAAGKCAYCTAPSGTATFCPRHTCRGGEYVDGDHRWRRRPGCGRPVHRWMANAEPHAPQDAPERSGPHAELGEYGARPTVTEKREWVYAGLCEECGRDEREGRALLRKLAEEDERPSPASISRRSRGGF
jgi:hypothetical protein